MEELRERLECQKLLCQKWKRPTLCRTAVHSCMQVVLALAKEVGAVNSADSSQRRLLCRSVPMSGSYASHHIPCAWRCCKCFGPIGPWSNCVTR